MAQNIDIYGELDNLVEENEGQVSLTDAAKHFCDYGYQKAIDFACEFLDNNLEFYLGDYNLASHDYEENEPLYGRLINDLRKAAKGGEE